MAFRFVTASKTPLNMDSLRALMHRKPPAFAFATADKPRLSLLSPSGEENLARELPTQIATAGSREGLRSHDFRFCNVLASMSTKGARIGLIGVLSVAALCCVGSILTVTRAGSSADAELATEKAEAKKIGMPLEISDLHLASASEAENAATIYRQLDRMDKERNGKADKIIEAGLRRKATPEDRSAADSALASLRPEFDLLDSLDKFPECSFNRDWAKGPALLFPEFAGMKRDVKHLSYRADLQDREGDSAEALKSLETGTWPPAILTTILS
jgi:hypothetical protein